MVANIANRSELAANWRIAVAGTAASATILICPALTKLLASAETQPRALLAGLITAARAGDNQPGMLATMRQSDRAVNVNLTIAAAVLGGQCTGLATGC
jgi:hypothetical protein